MTKRKNVLIYPSGADNAIEVYSSIRNSVHLEVIPSSGKVDHSELIYDNEVAYLPYIQEEGFLASLNDLIAAREIDFIFPTHDSVALFLSQHQEEIHCQVITSPYKTNDICRHKRKTYETFGNEYFCPVVYEKPAPEIYPIFSKPNVGEGSKGVKLIHSQKEHISSLEKNEDQLFVEYLPGKEYTVDCFTDRKGELKFVGPRERVEVKMGLSFKSREVEDVSPFAKIAERINSVLEFRGLWFFQVKEDIHGNLKLLEISTRVAGTMGFFRHKGVNLPLLSVFDFMGFDVKIAPNEYSVELLRSTINRYNYGFEYNKVYLDLDDTLIVKGKVNLEAISLVYQCKNLGKKVILITKHPEVLDETLAQNHIPKSVFDDIILLKEGDRKCEHMEADHAIFVDNWYKERAEAREAHGIPVFDVDAIKSLLRF